jgi:hypothetical protein
MEQMDLKCKRRRTGNMKLICSSTLAVAGIGSSQVCLVAMQSIAYTRHHLQLDDYIAKCCTISGYHKTYAHVL